MLRVEGHLAIQRMHVEARATFQLCAQAMDLGSTRQEHQRIAIRFIEHPPHLRGQRIDGTRRQRALLRQCRQPLAEVVHFHGKHPSLRLDHRRITQSRRDRRAIDGGRHHHELQRQAQRFLRLPAQHQPEIRMQAALVEFVEQHGRDAFQRRILLQHAREDAFGDHLEPRARTHLGVHAHAVAHRLADAFAQ